MSIERVNMALNDQITSVSGTARDLVYTASNGVANIAAATAYNSNGSAVDVTLCILTDDTISGTVTEIETVSVPAGESASLSKLIGHNVPSGGSIQAYAGTTDVIYLTISGTTKV